MNAGLPTTGIGGIFYIISVIMMIMVELILTIQGRSNWNRWKFVLGQFLLVLGIIASSLIMAYVLVKLAPTHVSRQLASFATNQQGKSLTVVAFIPFITLFALLAFTQAIRGYFVLRKKVSKLVKQK